jgi:hypothetical protein
VVNAIRVFHASATSSGRSMLSMPGWWRSMSAQDVPRAVQSSLMSAVGAEFPRAEGEQISGVELVEVFAGVQHDLRQDGENLGDLAASHAAVASGGFGLGERDRGELAADVGE